MRKKLFFFTILLFSKSITYSQKSDNGNWWMYFGNQKLSEKVNWHNEVQHRNYNIAGDLQQLLLRTGLGYNLSENNNNILLGYGYIKAKNYIANTNQKIETNEHRIYQQYITKQSFGRFYLQHRYRIEERFLSTGFQLRFRYFFGLNIPLNQKTMDKKSIYLSAYNEVMLNAQSNFFDQNRLYGALGYVINKNFRFELGFMNQTMQTNHRNQFQVALFNTLPLKK